jgi:hypothetical protein
LELGVQAASFDRAAAAYASAVGGAMSGDSVRRITEGEGAKMLAVRAAEVECANAPVQLGEVSLAHRISPVQPIADQANVSTDGVFIRIRGEDWKEVKITTVSQVSVCPRPADQITVHHPVHEPVIRLTQHSYQATLGDAADARDDMAGWQFAEGLRRGLLNGPRLTSVNDGAAWIERITQANFPNAIQIVDWAHAAQHVYAAAQLSWPSQTDSANANANANANAWIHAQLDELWRGDPLAVASAIALLPSAPAAQSASYFSDNANRMRYADFRARGLPIGSGSVESAGKTVLQHRLKRPCRGWTRANAKAMIVALCELHSNRLDAIWRQL